MSTAPGPALILLSITLAACAQMPSGPTVAVMPAPGKPMQVFEQDDAYCRGYSQHQIAGAQNPNDKVAMTAAGGAVIGAAASALLGGRSAVGSGATTGLLFGTAAGAGAAQQSAMSLQRRYDIAYEQCMYAKGNQIPGYRYGSSGYPPAPPAAPLRPSGAWGGN